MPGKSSAARVVAQIGPTVKPASKLSGRARGRKQTLLRERLNAIGAAAKAKAHGHIAREQKMATGVREVTMTPAWAAELLERNRSNRSLRDDMIDRYARDMAEGRWVINGETIKLSVDGDIIDGQHRLWAVVISNATVPMLLVRNLDPNVMSTVDTGTARTLSDALTINGIAHASETAAAMRWWMYYTHDRKLYAQPRKYTHGEMIALYERMPQIHNAIHLSTGYRRARALLGAGLFAFIYSAASLFDPVKADQWASALDSGENLNASNPAYSLREKIAAARMARTRLPAEHIARFAIKSWNHFATGKTYKHYKITPGEAFPDIIGVKG